MKITSFSVPKIYYDEGMSVTEEFMNLIIKKLRRKHIKDKDNGEVEVELVHINDDGMHFDCSVSVNGEFVGAWLITLEWEN